MGLRLLAVLYERNEALLLRSVLDAAGLLVFLENADQIAVQPFSAIGLGGYRVMVVEEELDAALAVVSEARRNRLFEGERLTRHHVIVPHLLLSALGQFWVWYFPIRRHSWREV